MISIAKFGKNIEFKIAISKNEAWYPGALLDRKMTSGGCRTVWSSFLEWPMPKAMTTEAFLSIQAQTNISTELKL